MVLLLVGAFLPRAEHVGTNLAGLQQGGLAPASSCECELSPQSAEYVSKASGLWRVNLACDPGGPGMGGLPA